MTPFVITILIIRSKESHWCAHLCGLRKQSNCTHTCGRCYHATPIGEWQRTREQAHTDAHEWVQRNIGERTLHFIHVNDR
jgi:hypothetical protein